LCLGDADDSNGEVTQDEEKTPARLSFQGNKLDNLRQTTAAS
jgi:hypothetical protein